MFNRVVDSREPMPPRGSSSSQSSSITPHVSRIHLNYELTENHLREMQEVLMAEQEDHRAT
jgi:maleate cis-trans isomerase